MRETRSKEDVVGCSYICSMRNIISTSFPATVDRTRGFTRFRIYLRYVFVYCIIYLRIILIARRAMGDRGVECKNIYLQYDTLVVICFIST